MRGTPALTLGIALVAAWAWVGGRDQREPGGELDRSGHAGHDDAPILERLAQRFHGIASELGQLIQEQDAMVSQCSDMSPDGRPTFVKRPVPSTDTRDMHQRGVTPPAATEPFVVTTPAGTRLLGLVGLLIGFGLGIWAWMSELPLWWKTLMSAIGLPFVAVGSQYVLLGRYPAIVLDQVGITYRPFEDPITLLRRGPIVRLRWDEITSIGTEHGRYGNRWLTIRSNRTPQRPQWLRALGAGERAPFIRISLSVLPVSEETLFEQLRVRALPHRFADEREE